MQREIRTDLFHLAWPAVLAMVVHHLYRLNDQFFVQDLGVEAQAAVAVGSMFSILFVAFGEMVGIGTLAVSARRFGEGDETAAHATIRCAAAAGTGTGHAWVVTVAAQASAPSAGTVDYAAPVVTGASGSRGRLAAAERAGGGGMHTRVACTGRWKAACSERRPASAQCANVKMNDCVSV